MSRQLRRFAFTFYPTEEYNSYEDIIKTFKESKQLNHYIFQYEICPSTHRTHVQGRVSFKNPVRIGEERSNILPGWHLSIEHDEERSSFYCMKSDTRIDGPWSDKDEMFVDPIVQEFLRSDDDFSKIDNLLQQQNRRQFYYMVDPVGKIGKTKLMNWLILNRKGVYMPILPSVKDMVQFAIDNCNHNDYIIFNVPRQYFIKCSKEWRAFVNFIEMLKDGTLYDTRYKGRKRVVAWLKVLILMNEAPYEFNCSPDRPVKLDPAEFFGAAL